MEQENLVVGNFVLVSMIGGKIFLRGIFSGCTITQRGRRTAT
jgi:glutamate synthase domain-containing protein 3